LQRIEGSARPSNELRCAGDKCHESLEELRRQWRDLCAMDTTSEDIRQRLDDYAAGGGEPVVDAFVTFGIDCLELERIETRST
jgi:hypothetical protein